MIAPKIEDGKLLLKGKMDSMIYDVTIPSGVSLFYGDSATGKSYLFRQLLELGESPVCPYTARLYDYHNFHESEEQLIAFAANKSLVLFDNADFYLKSSVIEGVLSTANFVLVAARGLDFMGDFHANLMHISFELSKLTVTPGGFL